MKQKPIFGITFLIAAVFSPSFSYAEESNLEDELGIPNFKLVLKDYSETKDIDDGLMLPDNPFLAADFFDETTQSMLLRPDGVSVTGYVSGSPAKRDVTDLDGKKNYSWCMIGNGVEGGSLEFHFNEDFIFENNGLKIGKVVLTYGVNCVSADPGEVTINGVTASLPYNEYFPVTVEFPSGENFETLTISTTDGNSVAFDEIWVYLSDISSVIRNLDADDVKIAPRYYSLDGRELLSPSAGVPYIEVKDSQSGLFIRK